MTEKTTNASPVGIASIAVPCSARKEKLPSAALVCANLPRASQEQIASRWAERLRQPHGSLVPAKDLYAGASFKKARRVADQVGASLFALSAGLGLLKGETAVPPYDLTLSPGATGALSGRVIGKVDARWWWDQVQDGPFASPVTALGDRDGRILIGLTRPYAALVGTALASLPPGMLARLRICGSGLAAHVPTALHPQLLHYDARLDVISPGTRLDGAARYLEHFAGLAAESALGTVAEDQRLIDDALSDIIAPPAVKRPRITDSALRKYIRPMVRKGLSATSALKHLRSQALVACEERRFRRLYEEVAA